MFNIAKTAPKDGTKFFAYWVGDNRGRRLIKWNVNSDVALSNLNTTVAEPDLAEGWITQDESPPQNIDGEFSFWSPLEGVSFRRPFPSADPFVPTPDQEVLARLAYKLQEKGYDGSLIFECLVPEGGERVNVEATLDKIIGYMTGDEKLPKLDPKKPWQKF